MQTEVCEKLFYLKIETVIKSVMLPKITPRMPPMTMQRPRYVIILTILTTNSRILSF